MVEISNNDELKSWLEGQKQPVHIAIATRAALRAFPFVAVTIAHKNKKFDAKTLTLLTARAIITSAVEWNAPAADVKAAARSASSTAYSAYSAASSTSSAAYSAASSAYSAAYSAASSASSASSAYSASSAALSASSASSDANTIDPNMAADLLQYPCGITGNLMAFSNLLGMVL